MEGDKRIATAIEVAAPKAAIGEKPTSPRKKYLED
jgi:hypothetical protein